MSGRSRDQESSSSGRTSQTTSPQSIYGSAPSYGSSAQQGTATGPGGRPSTSSSSSSQQQGTSGYVSPYPPIPTASTAVAEAGPVPVMTTMRALPQARSQTSSSATTGSSSLQEARQQAQKQALIDALNEHRINTIGELRRVERMFATLGSADLTQPMTAAWVHYVNSNSLLSELRGLTRNYPFSSECLDEAKRRVHQDPASNRSWNYCWLVLAKVHIDRLIPAYARAQASRPEMWGGRIPLAESVEQLAQAFVGEWNAALAQFLRYWESPPIR